MIRLLLAACVIAPIAVVGARMVVEGRAAIAAADRLAGSDDATSVGKRIMLLGRAARRALPGGPAARARAQLAELGRRGSLAAWEELRSAILATRWLATPDPALLDEANRAIAVQRGVTLARLEDLREPSRPLALLSLVGLALFVLGSARGLRAAASRPRAVALAAVGLGLFLVGLWRA